MQKKVFISSVLLAVSTLSISNAAQIQFVDVINTPVGVFASDSEGFIYKESEIGSIDWTNLGSAGYYGDVHSIKYLRYKNSYGILTDYLYLQTDQKILTYDIGSQAWSALPDSNYYNYTTDTYFDMSTGSDLIMNQFFFWNNSQKIWSINYSFFTNTIGQPIPFTNPTISQSGKAAPVYALMYMNEDELTEAYKGYGITKYPETLFVLENTPITGKEHLTAYDFFTGFSNHYGVSNAPDISTYSHQIPVSAPKISSLGISKKSSTMKALFYSDGSGGLGVVAESDNSYREILAVDLDLSELDQDSFISEKSLNNYVAVYYIGVESGTNNSVVYNLRGCDDAYIATCVLKDSDNYQLDSKVKYIYEYVVAGNLILVTDNNTVYYYDTNTKQWSRGIDMKKNILGIRQINDHIIYILYQNAGMIQYDFSTNQYTQVGGTEYSELVFDKFNVATIKDSNTITIDFLAIVHGSVQNPIYYNYYVTNTDTGQLVSSSINLESGKYQVDVAPGHYRVTVVAQDQYSRMTISDSVNVTVEETVKKYDFEILKDLTINQLGSDYVVVSFAIAKKADAPAPQNTVIAFEEKNLKTGDVRTGTIKRVDGAYLGKLTANTDYELTYTITADNYNTLVRSVSYKTLP
ncbi:hypothetical protein [Francisella philomiragia]|uniref:hypothetical protein n=1 Tax=Francisella philomiragia TaxID=28110 RepID=UPI003518EB0D